MFGFIVFLTFFGYLAYNVYYMSKHTVFGFWDGLQMFFLQGALDLWEWLKYTAWPWLKEKLGKG